MSLLYITTRKGGKPIMVENSLFEAVKLLDEIIDGLVAAKIAPGKKGSSRLLLIRLRRLRNLLGELDQRDRSIDPAIVGVVLREAVRWVAEMINNIQYQFRSHRCGHEGSDRATGFCTEVLSIEGRHKTKGVRAPGRHLQFTAFPCRVGFPASSNGVAFASCSGFGSARRVTFDRSEGTSGRVEPQTG